jgi:MazG family protein
MPLLVVCLRASETDELTLGEYETLRKAERVVFEDPDHPLAHKLDAVGIACGALDDEPDPSWEGVALVADPESPRIVDLAEKGATVAIGAASLPDALTAARVAPFARHVSKSLVEVAGIMARLRGENGCPWDARQTHESLRIHLLEETYEVLEAIDEGRLEADLEEELGDLLLQIAFHSELARREGRFDLASVGDVLSTKLIHRHPHVFGDVKVKGPDEVVANWESLKKKEKGREDTFADMPPHLPALLSAYKTLKRAASLGVETDEESARSRLDRALGSDTQEALGDALFWLVAIARSRGVDPESALRTSVARFQQARVTSASTIEEAL